MCDSELPIALINLGKTIETQTSSIVGHSKRRQVAEDYFGSVVEYMVDQAIIQSDKASNKVTPNCGKFGWCIICRKEAPHYCVDTRFSVCSKPCKLKNMERIALLEANDPIHDIVGTSGASGSGEKENVPTINVRRFQQVDENVVDRIIPDIELTRPQNANGFSGEGQDAEVGADGDGPALQIPHVNRGSGSGNGAGSTLGVCLSPSISTYSASGERANDSLNIYQKDAMAVFRCVCRLSMQDGTNVPGSGGAAYSGNAGHLEANLLRSRKMALELLVSMLEHCGPVFRSTDRFINEVKKTLIMSLIKNSVYPDPKIFHLAFKVFVQILDMFKDLLRNELGVFIEEIFLRILDSGNSTYKHKHVVLEVFKELCSNAETAVQLFINFDCSVDGKDLFERMTDCLARIAQGKYATQEHSLILPQQETELRGLALTIIVTLVSNIVEWAEVRGVEEPRLQRESSPVRPEFSNAKRARSKSPNPSDRATSKSPAVDSEGNSEGHNESTDRESDATDSRPVRRKGIDDGGYPKKRHSTKHSAAVAQHTTQQIQNTKTQKAQQHEGVIKFNQKPRKGLEFLVDIGYLKEMNVEEVCRFFKNPLEGIDKTAVGDYLGEDKEFNLACMAGMVDSHNFENAALDDALRSFLADFRLPGESQKIDRMMERFASKYVEDNPDAGYANPDAAYILSFALIMLQTDAHNPGVRNKMTVDQFISTNRGINDGEDFPKEMLVALYESILANPLTLPEDEAARVKLESQSATQAQKHYIFMKEKDDFISSSIGTLQKQLNDKNDSGIMLHGQTEHIEPMFKVIWAPLLATFAVLMESEEDPEMVKSIIGGFKNCIKISSRFDMEMERETFVSSLAKFTNLTQAAAGKIEPMKEKNVMVAYVLMKLGQSESNKLGDSWFHILNVVSQVERLQHIAGKNKSDKEYFPEPDKNSAKQKKSAWGNMMPTKMPNMVPAALTSGTYYQPSNAEIELANASLLRDKIPPNILSTFFDSSVHLSPPAIVSFVEQLAAVSSLELKGKDPRIFSLQKLVEVASANMSRVRYVWSRIWRIFGDHVVQAATHPIPSVGHYAIDSLKQLAFKFLEKDELSSFNFQAEFLRPFETVFTTATPDMKELIVHIMYSMVMSRSKNIKSGWKTVLHILYVAGQSNDISLQTNAFGVLESIAVEHQTIFLANLSDAVRCCLAFGANEINDDISVRAVKFLLIATESLVERQEEALIDRVHAIGHPTTPTPRSSMANGVDHSESDPVKVVSEQEMALSWIPVLRGLSSLITDHRKEIRLLALDGLFDVLRAHGDHVFDRETWQMVFRGVLCPLFDDIHDQLADVLETNGPTVAARSWATNTCLAAFTALVKLMDTHFSSLAFLLPNVMKLLTDCAQNQVECIARIGVEGFKQFLLLCGGRMDSKQWCLVSKNVHQLIHDSMYFLFLITVPNEIQNLKILLGGAAPTISLICEEDQK